MPSLKIFLVENHDDTLVYLAGYLEDCGHKVQSARTMTQAMEVLSTEPFDVLISDIGLPDGDGWQLMQKLSEILSPLPFGIAISGYGAHSDVARSRQVGYQHHLIKPFMPDELDMLIQEASTHLGKN